MYIYIFMYKGIQFIVLYPPKCSHDLPSLAGTVHTETISIPRGIFQASHLDTILLNHVSFLRFYPSAVGS